MTHDRTDDYYATCKPSEYSADELADILANCGPIGDRMPVIETANPPHFRRGDLTIWPRPKPSGN